MNLFVPVLSGYEQRPRIRFHWDRICQLFYMQEFKTKERFPATKSE